MTLLERAWAWLRWRVPHPGDAWPTDRWDIIVLGGGYHDGVVLSGANWQCNAEWGPYRCTRFGRSRTLGYLRAILAVVPYRLATAAWYHRNLPNGGIPPRWVFLLEGDWRNALLPWRKEG